MRQLLIKIRRDNGSVEELDVADKFAGMNAVLFAKIQKANRDSGRGEVLSYREVLTDDRSESVREYDKVLDAQEAARKAEYASEYSPERIITARIAAQAALDAYNAKYPQS